MALADDFQRDPRRAARRLDRPASSTCGIADESRYIEAALYLRPATRTRTPTTTGTGALLRRTPFRACRVARRPSTAALELLDEARDRGRDAVREVARRAGRDDAEVGPPGVRARGVPQAARAVTWARSGAALSADLLFASRVQGQLSAAGEQVELIGDALKLRERLAQEDASRAAVLIVDLTDSELRGEELVRSLREDGASAALATLGFYSHVDGAARGRAQAAGFDLVVPRSRMAREGADLVARLAARQAC